MPQGFGMVLLHLLHFIHNICFGIPTTAQYSWSHEGHVYFTKEKRPVISIKLELTDRVRAAHGASYFMKKLFCIEELSKHCTTTQVQSSSRTAFENDATATAGTSTIWLKQFVETECLCAKKKSGGGGGFKWTGAEETRQHSLLRFSVSRCRSLFLFRSFKCIVSTFPSLMKFNSGIA